MAQQRGIRLRSDKPPHTIKVVYVDYDKPVTIYKGVDSFRYNHLVWEIRFMDGRKTCVQFDLVLRIEGLEPTEGQHD